MGDRAVEALAVTYLAAMCLAYTDLSLADSSLVTKKSSTTPCNY